MINCKKLVADLEKLFSSLKISNPTSIDEKSVNDFVTNLDIELQGSISRVLRNYKNVPVLGEESPKSEFVISEEYWVVDPLDGTSNFIMGIPLIASSIAFVSDGIVRFGLVYDFSAERSYWAELGGGSYVGSDLISRNINAGRPKLIGCSTGFLKVLNRLPAANSKVSAFDQVNFRVLGSQALQLCYVALGKLDANFSVEAKIWDDLAASLILTEAGCLYRAIALENDRITSCFAKDIKMRSVAGAHEYQFEVGFKLMKELCV